MGKSAITFLSGVLIVRYLETEQLGALAFVGSLNAMLAVAISLGLDAIVLRNISRDPDSIGDLLVPVGLARFGLATVAFATLLSFRGSAWLSPVAEYPWLLPLLSLGLFAAPFQLATVFFQSRLRSKVPQAIALFVAVVHLAAVAYCIHVDAGFFWVCILLTVATLLGPVLIAVKAFLEIAPSFHVVRNASRLLPLIRDAWPQTFASMALIVQAYSDQLMLGKMQDLDSAAQYNVCLKVIVVLSIAPTAIISSFSPSLAKLWAEHPVQFFREVHRISRLLFGICFVLVGLAMIVGPILLIAIYGTRYIAAASLLPYMAVRIALTAVGTLRNVIHVNANILRYSLLSVAAGTAANVAMNLVLIPSYGIYGAVAASFLSFAVTTMLLDFCFGVPRIGMSVQLSAWLRPWRPLDQERLETAWQSVADRPSLFGYTA